MTLIAYRVESGHAEIVTDSLSYTFNGRVMGLSGKTRMLAPYLRTVMLAQGSQTFSEGWAYALAMSGEVIADFDQLCEFSRARLKSVWEATDTTIDSLIVHVGYSPRLGRFVARAYPSHNDFEEIDAGSFFVWPTLDATAIGLGAGHAASRGSDAEYGPAPESVDDWIRLATRIREEVSFAPAGGGKVFIGGDLVHTRLEKDAVTRRLVHRFDSPADFAKMVQGTAHPDYQLGPCWCGTGQVLAACHPWPAGAPCTCGSGAAWAECCSPTDEDTAAASARLPGVQGQKAGRNDPCPCGSGRKSKRCCAAPQTVAAAGAR